VLVCVADPALPRIRQGSHPEHLKGSERTKVTTRSRIWVDRGSLLNGARFEAVSAMTEEITARRPRPLRGSYMDLRDEVEVWVHEGGTGDDLEQ
jgi:hypothetical protein